MRFVAVKASDDLLAQSRTLDRVGASDPALSQCGQLAAGELALGIQTVSEAADSGLLLGWQCANLLDDLGDCHEGSLGLVPNPVKPGRGTDVRRQGLLGRELPIMPLACGHVRLCWQCPMPAERFGLHRCGAQETCPSVRSLFAAPS